MKRLLVMAMLLCLQACGFTLRSVSVAPPTKTAELNDERNTIRISRGISMGVQCVPNEKDACDAVTLTASDPNVVEILPAYLLNDPTSQYTATGYAAQKDVFVLLAKNPGVTELTVKSTQFQALWQVTVLAR